MFGGFALLFLLFLVHQVTADEGARPASPAREEACGKRLVEERLVKQRLVDKRLVGNRLVEKRPV